jgi:hypothetical protein
MFASPAVGLDLLPCRHSLRKGLQHAPERNKKLNDFAQPGAPG